jgi:hypothetical protein
MSAKSQKQTFCTAVKNFEVDHQLEFGRLLALGNSTFETYSNESPPLSVSVSAKREFEGQRQRPETGPSHSTDRPQRQSAPTKPHQHWATFRTRKSLFIADCMVGPGGREAMAIIILQ